MSIAYRKSAADSNCGAIDQLAPEATRHLALWSLIAAIAVIIRFSFIEIGGLSSPYYAFETRSCQER